MKMKSRPSTCADLTHAIAPDIDANRALVQCLSALRFEPLPHPNIRVTDVKVGKYSQFAASNGEGVSVSVFHNIATPLRLDPCNHDMCKSVCFTGTYVGNVVGTYAQGAKMEHAFLPLHKMSQVDGHIIEVALSDDLLSDIQGKNGKIRLVRSDLAGREIFDLTIRGKSGYPVHPVKVSVSDSVFWLEFKPDNSVREDIVCQRTEALAVMTLS